MSLDLYIKSSRPVRHRGTGVFVREDGRTRELRTLKEVREHFPDADLSDIRVTDYEDDELFHMNLTHNLTTMASHVPIAGTDGAVTLPRDYEKDKPDFEPEPLTAYNLLWHPETNPLLKNEMLHRKDDNGEGRDQASADDDSSSVCRAEAGSTEGQEWDIEVTRITPELVRQLMAVQHYIANHREELSRYNPSNGWGTYEHLRDRCRDLLMAVLDIPVEDYGEYYIYCWT